MKLDEKSPADFSFFVFSWRKSAKLPKKCEFSINLHKKIALMASIICEIVLELFT